MFAVEVRDHVMIAHSFKGDLFGPAQALHGATFVIDVAFFSEELTEEGVVIDIGRAHDALKAVLEPMRYANLDTVEAFEGMNTTTEVVAKHIFDNMAQAARDGALGPGGGSLARIRVTLSESHVARAWYENEV